ncbi:cupin [Halorubrum sp. 48-1-W]|uniref:cupin domain-containing protein n=1 Tax=Halorubrum sp. 48-1-W TaxID=2249761 RepID=UPI000DCE7725|nr:cupin domain-containing protein [Halorubrum sp. 48-1-W]RAW45917.1 cupin [Halorubrum sp. 48-1-W]
MTDITKVAVEDLPDAPNPTRHKKEVDEAVGATEFGFNYYVADPGERLPWGGHRHPDHEELFYVLDGTIEVETSAGVLPVSAGEAAFVPPDTTNLARATGEGPARVIAVGAPKDSDGAIIEEPCPACGAESDRTYAVDGDDYVLSCSACGTAVDRLTPGPS